MSDADRIAEVYALRCACWERGYRPLAILSPGARMRDGTVVDGAGKPQTSDWLALAMQDPPWVVGDPSRASPLALNTGIAAGELIGVDVDVPTQGLADQIARRVEQTLGVTPLSCAGPDSAPRILLCYRAEVPFATMSTQHYRMPGRGLGKLEIVGQGGYVAAFGIHPVSWQPYEWFDHSPLDVPLANLPVITIEQAGGLIGEAEAILESAGGVVESPPNPPPIETITLLQTRGRLRIAKLIHPDGRIESWEDEPASFDFFVNPIANLTDLESLLRRLADQPDFCVVRAALIDPTRFRAIRRLLYPRHPIGVATLIEVPRRWVAIDIDELPRPGWIEASDLIGCACVAIRKLPVEFRKARFIVQATAGHGVKPGIRLRLWAWLDRPLLGAELKCWFKDCEPGVDPAIFGANQPIYTASPIFVDGSDHLPRRLATTPGQEMVAVPPPDQLTPPARHNRRARGHATDNGNIAGLVRFVANARQGNRNQALYWAGCRAAEQEGVDLEDAAAQLIAVAVDAGLATVEATATVASAFSGGRA